MIEFSGDVLLGFLYVPRFGDGSGGGSEPAGAFVGSDMVNAFAQFEERVLRLMVFVVSSG